MDSQLVDDNKVSEASHGVVSPLSALVGSKGSEKTGEDHDKISDNGHEDVGTAEASEESKIHQQEGGGDAPVDISCPVHLAVDIEGGVGDVLVGLRHSVVGVRDTITHGHREVGDGGKGGDERSQNVEETFLLGILSTSESLRKPTGPGTYHWDTESHGVKRKRRDHHDHEDNPDGCQYINTGCTKKVSDVPYHSVRVPVSVAFWTSGRDGTTVGMGLTEVMLADVDSFCTEWAVDEKQVR